MDVAGRARPPARADARPTAECDALLVTHLHEHPLPHRLHRSAALLLVRARRRSSSSPTAATATRPPSSSAAAGVDAGIEIAVHRQAQREPIAAARGRRRPRSGLEAEHVYLGRSSAATPTDWFPDVELVPPTGLVEALRLVKDAGEVARIEAAATSPTPRWPTVRHCSPTGRPRRSSALELDTAMRRLGRRGTSFETIVASGPNGAMPHHRPGDRPHRRGRPASCSTSAPWSTATAPT